MQVLILAGGFATRLWPLTEKRAKPLIYLNGKPIISHLVEKIPQELPIIVSTNQVFQKDFLAWRNSFPERKINIFIEDSGSEDFKKGALGATALVIQQLKLEDDLLLLAGDNLLDFDFKNFFQAYKDEPLLAVYDVQDLNQAKKFGVVITDGEKIIDFQEKPREPKSTLASTGCYIIPQKNLADIINYAQLKNDDLGGVFEYLLAKGARLRYFTFQGKWYDIGSFESYLRAHQEIQGDRRILDQAMVDPQSELRGAVYLGPGCQVNNSRITDAIIMEKCRISDCVIRNCVIDQDCELMGIDLNRKIIRAGTRIEGET